MQSIHEPRPTLNARRVGGWCGLAFAAGVALQNGVLLAGNPVPDAYVFLGAELGYRVGKWRASVQVAGDLTHVSAFSVWGNVPCVTRTDCNPELDQITYDEYGLMLGVNARPSLSYQLDRSLELIARASGSYFFVSGGNELNVPIGADVGLEYRF